MSGLGVLVVVLAALVANMPAVMEQWRTDRSGFIKTLELLVAYFIYCGLGLALLVGILPGTAPGEDHIDKVLALTGLIVGWIVYGALTLMRVVPRYREPPRWLMHFGIADVFVLGLMFGSFGAYLWW